MNDNVADIIGKWKNQRITLKLKVKYRWTGGKYYCGLCPHHKTVKEPLIDIKKLINSRHSGNVTFEMDTIAWMKF